MANSLRAKITKLRHDRKITEEEYVDIISKLDGHDMQIRQDAIDEFLNKLCDKCIQTPNECWNLECPFADDECQIIKIAEELKEGK